MIHPSSWLGGGVGAGLVLLAACAGAAHRPAAASPLLQVAVAPVSEAAVPEAAARQGLAPACAAVHRTGTCLAAGRSPTRLLRT